MANYDDPIPGSTPRLGPYFTPFPSSPSPNGSPPASAPPEPSVSKPYNFSGGRVTCDNQCIWNLSNNQKPFSKDAMGVTSGVTGVGAAAAGHAGLVPLATGLGVTAGVAQFGSTDTGNPWVNYLFDSYNTGSQNAAAGQIGLP